MAILAPTRPVFVLGLAAYGVGLGLVDATGNMQAVALEHRLRPGRAAVVPRGVDARRRRSARSLTLATGGRAVVGDRAGRACSRSLAAMAPYLRPRPRRSAATTTETDVPWRAIVMVGLALVVFYTVDTAAATWGPVYLDDVFDAPEELVALATLPYLVASGLVRLVGDRLTEQVGAVRLVRVGAAIAFVALAVIVAAPSWPVAVLGFTLLGCGVAVVAPLSFSAAAALAGRDADPATRQARVDAVVARFNQFNYAGALLGAVMTGAVGSSSLRDRLRRAARAGAGPVLAGEGVRAGGRACPPARPDRAGRPQAPPPPALRRCIGLATFLSLTSEPCAFSRESALSSGWCGPSCDRGPPASSP